MCSSCTGAGGDPGVTSSWVSCERFKKSSWNWDIRFSRSVLIDRKSFATVDKNSVTYQLVSDPSQEGATAFGLAFRDEQAMQGVGEISKAAGGSFGRRSSYSARSGRVSDRFGRRGRFPLRQPRPPGGDWPRRFFWPQLASTLRSRNPPPPDGKPEYTHQRPQVEKLRVD